MFEHACKQDRPVVDAVTDAFQGLRSSLKRQVSVGRDEVQIKGNVFHVAERSNLRRSHAFLNARPGSQLRIVTSVAPGGNFVTRPETAFTQPSDGVHAANRYTW